MSATSSDLGSQASSNVSFGMLQEVRTGRIRSVFDSGVRSAIYKDPRNGPVKVTKLGCEGDQQAYKFHGGPDKALLWYCSSHYDVWKAELSQIEHHFQPGGFGENLVVAGIDEGDVCLGDVFRIGKEVLISVREPRQPCHNLNRRFEMSNFSNRAQSSGRTGWYCSALKEGYIQAGDEIVLLARPNPTWTVRQVQHYLYKDMLNDEAMKELAEMDCLGREIRDLFANRLLRKMEDQNDRLHGGNDEGSAMWSDYTISERTIETPRILSIKLSAKLPTEKPRPGGPGSHARLKLGGDLVRAYSVVSGDQNCFELGIQLSDTSKGGSAFIHKSLQVGDELSVSQFANYFPLHENADRHIFIAGGIGLTAFVAATKMCEANHWPYHLHYLIRDSSDIAYTRYLEKLGKNVTIYDKSAGNICDVERLLSKTDSMAHVYCCGSRRLMDHVKDTAKDYGLDEANVHFEAFEVATTGDPFTAHLQKSDKTIKIPGRQTLMSALRELGLDVTSSCEVGNCGTCRVGVLGGRIDHRGTGLRDWEKGEVMLSCVSRGVGEIVLDI
jgi:MOSC domain-containing protein YiiM/ferredoxin-NADP reductase